MDTSELEQAVRDAFPIKAARETASLELVEVTTKDGFVWIVVRLIDWELHGAAMRIRAVKEQEVQFVKVTKDVERVRRFLRALGHVLVHALGDPEVETLLPHELLVVSPLDLVKATTEQDFDKALRAKSRLGRWIPTSTPAVA